VAVGDNYFEACRRAGDECADRIGTALRDVLSEEGRDACFEYQCDCGDGSKSWQCRISAFEHAGRRWAIVAHEDVTQRRRVEEELRVSEARFDRAIRGTADGLWEWDVTTGEAWYAPRFKECLGYAEDEFPHTEEAFLDALHPDDRGGVVAAMRDHLENGSLYDIEYRLRTKSGEYRWFRSRGVATRDDAGRPLKMSGSIQDVSDRRGAEMQLRQRLEFEHLLAALSTDFIKLRIEAIDDGIEEALRRVARFAGADRARLCMLSADGTHLTCSHEWCDRGVDSLKDSLQTVPTSDVPWLAAQLHGADAICLRTLEDLPPRAEAERRLLESLSIRSMLAVPLVFGGEVVGLIGFDAVRSEQAWPKETIGLLNIVGEMLVNAMHRKTSESMRQKLLYNLNERVKELKTMHEVARLLQSASDDLGDTFEAIARMLPDGWQFPQITRARVRFGEVERSTPGFIVTPWRQESQFEVDGVHGSLEIVCLEEPTVDGSAFLAEERALLDSITEQIRIHLEHGMARARLEANEQRFRTLVTNIPGAVYRCEWNKHRSMHYVSEMIHDLTGRSAEDFMEGRCSLSELVDPDDDSTNFARISRAVATGEPYELEYRVRHADGGERWVYDKGQAVYDADGELICLDGAMFDVTDRKIAEATARECRSLEDAIQAMEKVLGVVGHELRTPLAALRAMSELLLTREAGDSGEEMRFLQTIHDETVRMSDMVNNMLEAARLNSGFVDWNWSTVRVDQACRDAASILRPLVDGSEIEVDLEIRPETIVMNGDPEAIRRLIINLASNAAKHTSAGRITIAAHEVNQAGRRMIQIQVSDTGEGIADSVAQKLGQAFALNQGVIGDEFVKGAGLGLSICKGIAAAHGGVITVSSKVGEGATFTVLLEADRAGPAGITDEVTIIREAA